MNGNNLRLLILEVLRDRARASLKRPRLADLAETTGAAEEDLIDQLDILDSMGAIEVDRMAGGDVISSITGIGKLMLEEAASELAAEGPAISSSAAPGGDAPQWDVFICHASEDKEPFANDLADALGTRYRVWYDAFVIRVGDRLRRKIDEGLARSRFGVVVLSPNFFAKDWPQAELDGLKALESNGRKVILPVWLNIDFGGVASHSPLLASLYAANAADGIDKVVQQLVDVIDEPSSGEDTTYSGEPAIRSTEPKQARIIADAQDRRPRFEVEFGGAKTLEANFEPSFTLRQFSGDPVPDLQCRIRGPRLHGMEWEPTTGGQLERTAFIHAFDLTEPQVEDDFVEESQMGFEVRFRWRRAWRSEIHLWPITRDDLGYKVLWRIGSKILPPLLIDDSVE